LIFLNKMKIRKKDKVKILSGKDKGQTGIVDRVLTKKGSVLVGGLNLYKKHQKPRGEGKPGGIVSLSRPLAACRVALICPKCGKQTRIGYKLSGKEKVRICKKCGSAI
jgi:large subunit ribosomal protein L24